MDINCIRNLAGKLSLLVLGFAGAIQLCAFGQTGTPGNQSFQSVSPMAADAHPSFEVAAIKPSDPNDHNQGFHLNGNRIFIENQTVNSMIMVAYAVHEKQIVDGPAWLNTEKFDIRGVPDASGQPNLHQMQEMLQKLLKDRFKITIAREKRELPVFAITVTKNGPKLARSASSPTDLPDQTGNGNDTQRTMKFTNNSMADFALGMQYFVDRPVVDETELAGKFDFVLKWTPNELQATSADAAPGLFTAIQEQLGLKLVAKKSLADVLAIGHAEAPTEN